MSDDLAAAARAAGFGLVPLRKLREPLAQLAAALRHHAVDAVIDAGANRGQYAASLRAAGWGGPILSIEPEPGVHAQLATAALTDPRWQVLPPMALGAADGTAMLEVSAERDMSSLLPQTDLLQALSPTSHVEDHRQVAVRRLDGLREITEAPWRRLFVKLDLQGGEAAALDGAGTILDRIAGFQIELPLVELYRGERPWQATISWLAARGFTLHLLASGYYERSLARQLQFDGTFFRAGSAPSML